MESRTNRTFLLALVMLTAATALIAQERPDDDLCRDHDWGNRNRESFCEVREQTLSPRSVLEIDARQNGGITVFGWDRDEILVRAKVVATARTEADAEDLVSEVEVSFGSTIDTDGPRSRRRESWHVSFVVFAPRESNLDLESTNGGISIEDISGNIDFRVVNGGASLAGIGGDVRGRTTNGGVRVTLEGNTWQGRGLDVETVNGGITMTVPDDYNATLETGTVNGGIDFDFPITVQGRLNRRRITAELGSGGPNIRAVTTNGGVRIRRS